MLMKMLRIPILVAFFVLLGFMVNAEEKKLKLRGSANDSELKPVQINVSPDLLKIDKVLELKSKYKVAKNFAIETDKNLGKKKKIKYRGYASGIYKAYARSVVFIYNGTEGHESTGAGFLVDSSGVFLSNWHVTDKAESLYVWLLPESGAVGIETLFKDIDPYLGVVFAVDVEKDLALIKVNGLPKNLKVIEMGSNRDVGVGDDVVAIGHPNTYPWTLTVGTVSQIRPNHEWVYEDKSKHKATLIQHQIPISPGNSGGPLFSDNMKLVGINTLNAEGQNLNFAVAVDHAKQFLKDNPNVKNVNPVGALIKKDYPKAKEQDFNNNGVIDTWYIDDNKNGKIDTAFIDDDENGFVEGTLIDKNENGIWEFMILDTDEDGKSDRAYIDEDEDKKPDVLAYDYDQDGEWDKFEKIS